MSHHNVIIRLWRRFLWRLEWVLFDSALYARVRRRTHVLCLGDSHIRVFAHIQTGGRAGSFWFKTVCVGGATAQGVVNPNSQTNALAVFDEMITRARHWHWLVFQLGEVDCGFVIWYRAEKHGVSVESQLHRSIDNYCEFLRHVVKQGYRHVCVLSAPLPTIADDQDMGEVAHARKEVQTSQKQRTDLTLRYNRLLQQKCEQHGYMFLEITNAMLDSATGVISERYLCHDPLDHHLADEAYARLILERLQTLPQADIQAKAESQC